MLAIFIININFWFVQENNTLEQILQKHYKAINIESLQNTHSMELNGEIEFYLDESWFLSKTPSSEGKCKEYILEPVQYYYEAKYDGVQYSFGICINDNQTWRKDGNLYFETSHNTTEKLLYDQKQDITGHLYNWKKKGYDLQYEGEKLIGGKHFHCIKLIKTNSDQLFYYLNSTTFLIHTISFMEPFEDNEIWIKRYFENYKKVDGVMFPFKQSDKHVFGGSVQTTVHTYREVIFNPEINPSIFEMPLN